MSYLVEDLVESIKTRSLAPIAQSTFDDNKLILMADEEMQLKLVNDLIKAREDFFLTATPVDLIGLVANYPVPSRAIGNSLKQVFWIMSGSQQRFPLKKVDAERAQDYTDPGTRPEAFYFLGDEIVLLPTPLESLGQIEFIYPARPGSLTATVNCAKITALSQGSGTVQFNVNTDLTGSFVVGSRIDILSAVSPFKYWSQDIAISAITSTTIEVSFTDVVNAASSIQPVVGDYICPTGSANIPQIPIAFNPVLAQMVVVRLMESLGDINKLNAAKGTLADMRSEASSLIRNRVENSPDKIKGRNQIGRYFR